MTSTSSAQDKGTARTDLDCVLFHCARYNQITPIITMGLWGLADHLTQNGFPTEIVHTGIEQEHHSSFDVSRYAHRGLVLAGASAHWFPMTAESLDVLKDVKAASPECFTVLGGYSASYFWRQIMEAYPWIDGVIRGDGERPALELMQELKRGGRNLDHVPNLVWRRDGEIAENDFSYVSTAEDLQGIDFANYSKYLHNYEVGKKYYFEKSSLVADFIPTELPLSSTFYLLTGKGCVSNCTICGGGREAQQIHSNRRSCMFLPPEKVVATVTQAMRHGYRNMYVCFDPLPAKPRYFEYLRAIREKELDLDFSFGFWRLPTAEAITEFKKTSKNLLFDISPESISEGVRRGTKDAFYYSNEEMFAAIDLMYRERVYGHVYFCYFLPGETPADLQATREAVWDINARYPHYIEAIYIKISTDPASPLHREPEKHQCTLTVENLQEHVAKCREITNSNILVHSIDTVPRDEQERFERTIELDGGIKRIFRYAVKYLVRAFPSPRAFVEFLDGFYRTLGLFDVARRKQIRTATGVMDLLASHVRSSPPAGAAPYLLDLVEYVRAFTAALDAGREAEQPVALSGAALAAARLSLVAQATVVELGHDVFSANNKLIDTKSFGEIPPRRNWLLFVGAEGKADTFELNEPLYEVLARLKANKLENVSALAREVAALYSDDEREAAAIQADLLGAVERLVPLRILKALPVS